ncbi:MAG TPA: 3-isopropylmalate dehydrogenase [Chloroflexota bacterium]|nr:3-isopropylmalate dehydrogenase [Chloroflexota bacterium]
MVQATIAVLPGDGVGEEITRAALAVLDAVAQAGRHAFAYREGLIGGAAIDATGGPDAPGATALADETLEMCRRADAVLLGAIGGPKWDDPSSRVRPEQGLLRLRKELGLYANLRPVKLFPQLVDASPLKREIVEGTDLLVVRELTGGLYFGRPSERRTGPSGREAVDTMFYTEEEVRRVVRTACEAARKRRKHVTSVDKQNVLASSRLWREVASEVAREYPDVAVEHMLVDTAAMRLVRQPKSFDVVVTENTFGDILTDEASMLAGSMGMLPSASLGEGTLGLYEPIHGSAPSHQGKDDVNPIATILSAAMLLRYSLGLEREAAAVERAVEDALNAGLRTYDVMDAGPAGGSRRQVGTQEMAREIAARIAIT